MNKLLRFPFLLSAASSLVLAASGALGQEPEDSGEDEGVYAPLALESRPLPTRWQTDYTGAVQLGLAYTSDDNFMFGQYNGLNEKGTTVIGNLQWQDFSAGDSYWQLSLSDLGLDTREGELTWGRTDKLRLSLGFDSQQQVRNNSGYTPFNGSNDQTLPDNWESGLTTRDWATLGTSLHRFDRELARDQLSAELDIRLSDNWRFDTGLSYEEKQGYGDVGAAIYIDAASGDSALLRSPIDYRTTEFDLGLAYDGSQLHLEGRLAYSEFDNKDQQLSWQNPYSSFGPRVRYPQGTGALGVMPDNEQTSGRLTGQYIFSSSTRLQFDGSYAVATQDQDYLDYTANDLLTVTEPLPRSSFDGEVATGTANIRLLMRPMPKLNLEAFYKLRDRDYDTPRDGYRYVRGDGGDQPRSALTIYNTAHDLLSQTAGFEAGYRLPMRSKLSFEYEFENVQRRNAAVEETDEGRYTVAYRIQPRADFSARMSLLFADRAADTYHWDQSYYALLDTELINATPDNQRYITHPELSQYYLSNRERWEGKIDLSYLPSERWNLNLNMLWRDDDYDKTNLGLTGSNWQRLHFSASYVASDSLSGSVYAGFDSYDYDQSGRAFRGGQEKDAFDQYPPLPQASDPQQDWDLAANDSSVTLGANLLWQIAPSIDLRVDYNFVDSESEQDYRTRPLGTAAATNLPTVNTRLHHLKAGGMWHLRDNLSLELDYQYYRYSSDDWARQGVNTDTMAKVLSFGERNPNEQIHYLGLSAIYRWQ